MKTFIAISKFRRQFDSNLTKFGIRCEVIKCIVFNCDMEYYQTGNKKSLLK
jgi:hypothetical protein